MKRYFPRQKHLSFYIALALTMYANLYCSSLRAASVSSVGNGAWDDGDIWSDGAPASTGNSYTITSDNIVNSPAITTTGSTHTSFPGSALTVNGTLQLPSTLISGGASQQLSISAFTLTQGAFLDVRGDLANIDRTLSVPTGINFSGAGTANIVFTTSASSAGNNTLTVAADTALRGSENIDLTFNVGGLPGPTRRMLVIDSANNPYTGQWGVISSGGSANNVGWLVAGAANALGTGNVTLSNFSGLRNNVVGGIDSLQSVAVNDNSVVELNQPWRNPNTSLNLEGVNARLNINSAGGANNTSIGNLTGIDTARITGADASSSLTANQTTNGTFDGVMSGGMSFIKEGNATLSFGGTNIYTGITTINDGTLKVLGLVGERSGSLFGSVVVNAGASLSGGNLVSNIGGNLTVNDGAHVTPSSSSSTVTGKLAVGGILVLGNASQLDYKLGIPDKGNDPLKNDVITVGGNLTLGGKLNVIDVGGFGLGVYRLIDYGGSLTNNVLGIDSVPNGFTPADFTIQTSVQRQVNLIVAASEEPLLFWDGTNTSANGVVNGGTAVWNTTTTNWTNQNGSANARWGNGFAVFMGEPGTVTLGENIRFTGMEFITSGYAIVGNGSSLQAAPDTILRVDPNVVATINAPIVDGADGPGKVTKTDGGTLTLAGNNTYSGGTAIDGGLLQVAADQNLGSASGALSLDGGTLATTATFTSERSVTLLANGGTFAPTTNTALALTGVIAGSGALNKTQLGTLILSGNNTYSGGTLIGAGVLATSGDSNLGAPSGALTFDGGTLRFDASYNLASSRAINLNGLGGTVDTNGHDSIIVQNIVGTGSLIKQGAGTLALNGSNSYIGPTLINGGTLQVNGSITSDTDIAAPGTLSGSGTVIGNVINQGAISLGGGQGINQFGALTVHGNYAGVGGNLVLHTVLGDDESPSDQLVINGGQISGSTKLVILHAGGIPAETLHDGILVVDVINGGSSAPNAFTLANEVRSGAFDYRLFRGSINGRAQNDWFLRNTFEVTPLPGIEPTPVPLPNPVEGELPVDPPPPPPEPGIHPIIGPEPPLYSVIAPIAQQLGLLTLGTLHERVGDNPGNGSGFLGQTPIVWGRIFGQHINNQYHNFFASTANGNLSGFQSGIDLWRGALLPEHRDHAGFYAAYSNANVNVNGLQTNAELTGYTRQSAGSLNLDAWSGGLYWTHYGPSDWYVDSVLQITRYGGHASTEFTKLGTQGTGWIASLESGYPFPLPQFGPGMVLEPQAQIVWQRVGFDDGSDGQGKIVLGNIRSTSGRLGARANWQFLSASGQLWQPALTANLWKDWNGRTHTVFDDVTTVPTLTSSNRVELGGALTVKLKDNLSLYGNAAYQLAVSHADGGARDGIKANAGLSYSW